MAKNKTTETENNVTNFINEIKDETKRNDCLHLVKLIEKRTGFLAKMWGTAIVGFGSYHYKYESGREGDSALIAFSPRKSSIALYLSVAAENREAFLQKLGKHKTDKGCIHIKKLDDINVDVLLKMVSLSIEHKLSLYKTNL